MGGMAVRDGWFVLDAAGFSIDCGAGRNTLADYTLSILLAHCFCRREGSLHLRASGPITILAPLEIHRHAGSPRGTMAAIVVDAALHPVR